MNTAIPNPGHNAMASAVARLRQSMHSRRPRLDRGASPLSSEPVNPGHGSVGMVPLFVGTRRRLFVTYHPSHDAPRRDLGVVLCNPFGQEALRAHRLYRVLAERLARSGVDVMRFDYFGTGDSFGDDEDGDLAGWADDIRSVHDELVRRSGAREVDWIGIRLGATLMLRARDPAPQELRRLVLVDPIVDGSGYARTLREQHVKRMEEVFRVPKNEWRRRLDNDPAAYLDEASGYGLAPGFHAQLAQLDGSSLPLSGAAAGVTVIFSPADAAMSAWRAMSQPAGGAEWIELEHGYDWSAHEAIGGTLLPATVLRQLVHTVLDRTT